MAALSSSTALSSSSVNGLHQRIAFSSPPPFLLPQRFLSAKLSLQCRRNSHPNMVLMEDGNFILYSPCFQPCITIVHIMDAVDKLVGWLAFEWYLLTLL